MKPEKPFLLICPPSFSFHPDDLMLVKAQNRFVTTPVNILKSKRRQSRGWKKYFMEVNNINAVSDVNVLNVMSHFLTGIS